MDALTFSSLRGGASAKVVVLVVVDDGEDVRLERDRTAAVDAGTANFCKGKI